MWATIEHLTDPEKFIKKAFSDLEEGGCFYISTCRSGIWNFKNFFGKNWRYYNFPEHIYFFTKENLMTLLKRNGFKVTAYRTYGSGMDPGKKLLKKLCDFAAKKFKAGDMMLLAAVKDTAK